MNTHISNNYINELLNTFSTYIHTKYVEYHNLEVKTSDNFVDYLFLDLYESRGIRRKRLGDDIYHLTYVRKYKLFNPLDQITQLCKYMILDTNSFRIISFGIPRRYENISLDGELEGYNFERFYDGSMIVYNPSLLNEERINVNNFDDENIQKKDISISTRTNLGTSFFNSIYTFAQMFQMNNSVNSIDLSKLPDDMVNNKCYAFVMSNMNEHLTTMNNNILVGSYEFKDTQTCLESWNNIMNSEPNSDDLLQLFNNHFNNMITSYDLRETAENMINNGVGSVQYPEVVNINNNVCDFLQDKEYDYAGLSVYDNNGRRTRILNEKFEYGRGLCYGLQRIPLEKNNQNLFYIYWALRQEDKISEFIDYYDFNGLYRNIFDMFEIRIGEFVKLIYRWYMDTHVKRKKGKEYIPKFLKPVLYKLHGEYLESNEPITRQYISNFVSLMEKNIYGRLFTPVV